MSTADAKQIVRNKISSISVGSKFGYGIGDFAFNASYQMIAFFLLIFYTDVFGISPAVAGSIFLFSKVWDAVSDPIMGYITDRTNSRWGKKRPYIFFGAVPLGISIFLLFAAPGLQGNLKIIYALLTFLLFCTAITVTNVPYGSLTAAMTTDSNERSSISGYRMTFALLGTLFAAGITKLLVSLFPDEITGFRCVSAIFGIMVIIILWITFFSTKERVVTEREERVSFIENFRVIIRNKPFIILTFSTLLFMIAMNLMAIIVNYYFKYNLNNEAMIPVAFLSIFLTAALLIPLYVYISKKKSKKYGLNIGMGVLVLSLLILFFFGEKNIIYTIIILIIAGAGLSAVFLFPWAMIPDTVEYSEWKTGLRREGIIYGFFWVSFKIGTAIAGFIAGWGLDLSGYVNNVIQSETSLLGIRLMISFIPILFIISGIILISFYPIDAAFHKKIIKEINNR